jgi:lipoprotein-anchoring transpeptidase ErfK/SrfK
VRNHLTRARSARTISRFRPATGRLRLTACVSATAAAAVLVTGCGQGHGNKAASAGAGPSSTAKAPQATTFTTLHGLPREPASATVGDGTVVHPKATVPVSATPGGPAVAALPSTQLGAPTWVPVVDEKPGWYRVLLPSRPNGAAGWIADTGLQTARSPYAVTVDLSARRLTLRRSGRTLGTWTVAVGAAKTPTPTGTTFVMALLAPPKPTYSPLILPLGAHSQTLDTFGGGPGTVAFHGWPQASVFGKAITNGCVRVPSDALTKLSKMPLGTLVHINA